MPRRALAALALGTLVGLLVPGWTAPAGADPLPPRECRHVPFDDPTWGVTACTPGEGGNPTVFLFPDFRHGEQPECVWFNIGAVWAGIPLGEVTACSLVPVPDSQCQELPFGLDGEWCTPGEGRDAYPGALPIQPDVENRCVESDLGAVWWPNIYGEQVTPYLGGGHLCLSYLPIPESSCSTAVPNAVVCTPGEGGDGASGVDPNQPRPLCLSVNAPEQDVDGQQVTGGGGEVCVPPRTCDHAPYWDQTWGVSWCTPGEGGDAYTYFTPTVGYNGRPECVWYNVGAVKWEVNQVPLGEVTVCSPIWPVP